MTLSRDPFGTPAIELSCCSKLALLAQYTDRAVKVGETIEARSQRPKGPTPFTNAIKSGKFLIVEEPSYDESQLDSVPGDVESLIASIRERAGWIRATSQQYSFRGIEARLDILMSTFYELEDERIRQDMHLAA